MLENTSWGFLTLNLESEALGDFEKVKVQAKMTDLTRHGGSCL
jgi:hypothetical protein